MTGLLFTILFFPLVGLAVSRLLGPMPWFLAGVGATGAFLFALGVARVPLLPALALLIVACVLVLAIRPRLRFERPHLRPRLPALLMLVAAAAILLISALVPLTDYDGRWFWLLKAKAIAHEGRIGGPFFQTANPRPEFYFLQRPPNAKNRYPLLLPAGAAVILRAAGELDERHVRWLYALIPIGFAFETRRRLSKWFTPAIGGWVGAIALWTPAISLDQHGGALSAYSDLALAAFAGCALFELVDGTSPGRAGFWIACAALTKDEGLLFAAVLLCLAALVFRRRIGVTLLPAGLALATLAAWRAMVPRTDEEHLASRLLALPQRFSQLDDAALAFAGYAFRWSDWGLLWLATAVAVGVLILRRQWRVALLTSGVLLAMFGTYTLVYTVTVWELNDLLHASARRLLLHLYGPALLAIGAAAFHARRPAAVVDVQGSPAVGSEA